MDRSGLDSAIAHAHQHATDIARHAGDGSNYGILRDEPAGRGIGRSRGRLSTKIHQLDAGAGMPLASLIA